MNASEPKSINLVLKNKDGQLELNQSALDFIEKIHSNLGVCVCVGPYRQGKSFLLNQLMQQKDLFKVGHGDESETKGVWLSKNVTKRLDSDFELFTALILDTEVFIILIFKY